MPATELGAMLVLFLILLFLCGYGVYEYAGHQSRLRRIPLRIHVNGSRGKSSVTRLIAAGLRAGGVRTVAKTTGTLPRIIDPKGGEIAILRDQRANIIEQVKILKYVERYKPEALVMECMAVLPEYQWTCEKQMVKSHIGVITNCRLDHTNEMGKFREQIALSLSNTCPTNSVLFTSEKTNLNILKKVASRLGTEIHRVGGKDITIDELRRFGHIEHPANVGLSLAICEWAGVNRQTALEGMYKSVPDAGALRVALCQKDDKELLFVNALAANDPESTLEIWQQIKDRFAPLETVVILLNSRADRQDRSIQLIEMVVDSIDFDYIVLTGEKTKKFMAQIAHYNVPKKKSIALGWVKPEKTYNKLFELIDKKGTILAIGNAGAGGLDMFSYFYKQRIFPVGLNCSNCNYSLMDESYLIDSLPSIHVMVSLDEKYDWLRLSTMYGSYKIGSAFEIPLGSVVKMYCPHCKKELKSSRNCPECGIPMILMKESGGGDAYLCPRRGCKGHLLGTQRGL
ncbi:MAG: poly-gamma-glutamate synthase PgsB [Candidatus Hatepunaea meridiana]|nr:poly-gamma-glutamate synthase PgsB [Candidatus Hatepunaea meridiana]